MLKQAAVEKRELKLLFRQNAVEKREIDLKLKLHRLRRARS